MRCPGASFICTARLSDHRFMITSRGVATITASPGRVVYGAIWRLTACDERSLDQFEGVPIFYRRQRIVVETLAGVRVDAFAYVATISEPGYPRPGYLDAVLVGAAERDLPDSYLAEIAAWALPSVVVGQCDSAASAR